MDNINEILAQNIQKFRKQKELTQEELADKLSVTYQAVSKWENAKSAPDIFFLPQLADVFECSIDTLFSRNGADVNMKQYNTICTSLPWEDDDTIRGVVCHGQRILTAMERLTDTFTFKVIGDTKQIVSECNISVNGTVNGGCNAKRSINIEGDVNGGLNCGDNVNIGGYHAGGINCGANVSCGGNIDGAINCGSNISCHNIQSKGIKCGSSISAGGDVNAEIVKIRKGEIACNVFQCETLKGNVIVRTKE